MVIAAFNKTSGFKNSRARYSGGIKNPGQVIHRGEKDGHEGYYSLETMPPHHRWFGQSLVGVLTLARLNFTLTLYDVIHKNYILIFNLVFGPGIIF
jgi:hypothetical protein